MKPKLNSNSISLEARIKNLQYRKIEVLGKHYMDIKKEIENLAEGEARNYLSNLLEEEYRKHYPGVRI